MIFQNIHKLFSEFRYPQRSLNSKFVNMQSPLNKKMILSSKKLAATKLERARNAERLIIRPHRNKFKKSKYTNIDSNYSYKPSVASSRATKSNKHFLNALHFPKASEKSASDLLVQKKIAQSKKVLAKANLNKAKPRMFPLIHKTILNK